MTPQDVAAKAGQQIGTDVGGYVTDNFLTPRGTHRSFSSNPMPATAPPTGGMRETTSPALTTASGPA